MSLKYLSEIFVYELIDILPNLFLALIPFSRHLRLSKLKTVGFVFLLYFMLISSRIIALYSMHAAALATVLWVFLYLIFYFISIKAEITKLLFVLLTILNYGSFVVIIYCYIIYHKYAEFSTTTYSFFSSSVLLCIYIISFPFIYWLIKKKIKPLLFESSVNNYWRLLWLVPATFCLSYYYNLYSNEGIMKYSSRLSNVLFAVFFNLGALFVTYLLMKLLEESIAMNALKEENSQLTMNSLQYENMKNKIDEARRAKHDLRQNLTVIQSYILDNDIEGLLQFIKKYTNTLPSDSPIMYCSQYALNAVIVYYESLTAEHHIRFEAEVEYPDGRNISDCDAVVLLGNLLENAVEACLFKNIPKPFISLRIKPIQEMLIITIDNSYSGGICVRGNSFLSSKTKKPGIGISSIQKIAEKYNGIVKFDFDGNEFHASVMLSTYKI